MMGSTGVWAGRVVSALVALFLLADGLHGLLDPNSLKGELTATGFTMSTIVPISVIALVCGVLYAVPRTAVLGAILTTGFLGGAIVTHFRVATGLIAPEIVSMVVGVLAWAGLWLRDARVRALLPISS